MKKLILKLKIIMTNISRVIMSFLFVNLNFSLANKVSGTYIGNKGEVQGTCYGAPLYYDIGQEEFNQVAKETLSTNTFTLKNVLIILVPVAIIIGAIILIVKRRKNKSKQEKKDVKKG